MSRNIFLPIVLPRLFFHDRKQFCQSNIITGAYSLSLEFTILAYVADVLCPKETVNPTEVVDMLTGEVKMAGAQAEGVKLADALAVKARILLDMESVAGLTTLASIQASVLLGWREAGTEKAGHFAAIAAQLATRFGIHLDPTSHGRVKEFSADEVNFRRLIYWGVFVFDRYYV